MYCEKCGAATSYNMSKPKFCQECGDPFSGTAPKRRPNKKEKATSKKTNKAEEKKEPIKKESIPQNINKLEFDTVGTLQVKGAPLGQLVGTSDDGVDSEREPSPRRKFNKEEFLKGFRKEAGTSRPKIDG